MSKGVALNSRAWSSSFSSSSFSPSPAKLRPSALHTSWLPGCFLFVTLVSSARLWAAEGKGHVSFNNPPLTTSSYLKCEYMWTYFCIPSLKPQTFWITVHESCQVATILILMRFKALWVICFYPPLLFYSIEFLQRCVFLFTDFREREERRREQEKNIDLLFYLFMYLLVDSCMSPDQGLNPHSWYMGTLL